MKLTVVQIADRLRSEADAWLFLEELRWGLHGEPVCSHCGNYGASFVKPTNGVSRKTRTGAETQRRVWRCFSCRKQFSVLTGTVFQGAKVSLRLLVLVVFEMCASKNGVSAREIERKYGVCPRTAWFLMHRIREAMKNDALVGTMKGIIVADETYIGGVPGNRHHSSPKGHGPNGSDKTPVLSLINKMTGEVRSRVMPEVTGATLEKAIAEQVNVAESFLQTDALMAYRQLGRTFKRHEWVDHSSGEYVRGTVTTNHAEGYFSQLKRSLDGTHHHVSVEHLSRYLAEFDFRYSTRKVTDADRMRTMLSRAGGRRLTYKRVSDHG